MGYLRQRDMGEAYSNSIPLQEAFSCAPNLFRAQTLVPRIHAAIRWTSATFPLLLGLRLMVSPIADVTLPHHDQGTLERWPEASRAKPGNRRFDVLRQPGGVTISP
jgi:hypothetical protein